MIRIEIRASRPYPVLIESGLLDRAGELLRERSRAETVCIVSGERVFPLCGQRLTRSLEAAGYRVLHFVHPSGECHKNLNTYGELLDALARGGLGRDGLLLSLGGGVTGDLTGFAAATYQRGLDYVQIPTSLLAMVDASVGGKTAVNLPSGKNLAGCFWQPLAVLCDPALLDSLPEEELRCGTAEVIKCAVLADRALFETLRRDPAAARSEDSIRRCVEIKRDLVEEDELDRGSRRLLNLGHSFGHAVELCSGYTLRHGQAVAVGLACIARACAARGVCGAETAEEILTLLKACGLPTETDYSRRELLEALLRDKKRSGTVLPLVLPEEIGRCRIEEVPVAELEDWLRLGGVK